jgi:hypothetical protein
LSIFPEANHKQSATICVESVGEALLLFPGVAHSHQGIHLLLQFVGFSSCIGLLKTLDLEGSSHSCWIYVPAIQIASCYSICWDTSADSEKFCFNDRFLMVMVVRMLHLM